jgi:hypothetical protein
MRISRAIPMIVSVAAVSLTLLSTARADEWDKRSTVTFSKPVKVPSVVQSGMAVLPAGTYVFKVIESGSDRHIVQILSQDEKKVFTTILAIPNLRLQATDQTVITFREVKAGEPEPLKAWFYPGKQWGEEFVYPKAQAIQVAKAASEPVLQMTEPIKVEAAKPAEPQIIAQLEKEPVSAVRPSGEEVTVAQEVTPPPAAELAQATPPPSALPKTASPLPLIALLGLLALGGGLTLRTAAVGIR